MRLNISGKPALDCAILLCVAALAGSAQKRGASGWNVIGPGGGGTTYYPTVSPHDPRIVVEASDMTGDYVTSDDGISWHMFNLREQISAFAFDPVDPKAIYAVNAALGRSSDLGRTWKMVFPNPARGTVEHLIGDRANYSLTSGDPAYPGGDITAIAIAPGKNGEKGTENLYLSFQPKGHSWIDAGPDQADVAVIVTSTGGGISWSRLATMPQRVLLLTAQDSGLIAVSGSAAYRIASDGSTAELGSIPTNVRAASAGRLHGAVWIYATGQNGKVCLSEDSGLHFGAITPELQQTVGNFEAIATSDRHPEFAYAGFRGLQIGEGKKNLFNGIAKSMDGGHSWTIVFKESNQPAANLNGTWVEQRARQDNGNIWFDAASGLGVGPDNPNVVYATDLFRTYRTLDGGTSWQEMNSKGLDDGSWTTRGVDLTTNYGVQFDPFDSKHIFIDNTDMGLFQSTNGGKSWRSTSEGISEDWRNTTYWLAFDPTVHGLIWGAFSGTHDLPHPKMWRGRGTGQFTGGVGVSTDGGIHWLPSSSGVPTHSITHRLLDPASPAGNRTLYACAFGLGVYKSTDNGHSWTRKNNGIAGEEPLAWRITPSQDGSLYLVVSRRS